MRIGYLLNNGVELHTQNSPLLRIQYLLDSLRNRGHRVTFVALDHPNVVFTDRWNLNQAARLAVSRSGVFRLLESCTRRFQGFLRIPYFALIDSFRFYEACSLNLKGYDILHQRFELFDWGGLLASRKLGIPLILDVEADPFVELELMGAPLRGLHKFYAAALYRLVLRRAQAITCVSRSLKEHLSKVWEVEAEKIYVLPNGVDIKEFCPDRESQSLKESLGITDELLVTFVGGFFPWHDIHLLLEAFQKILLRVPNTRLLLIGDGVQMPTVKNKIFQDNLQAKTILLGKVEHQKVSAYLSASDVCVAPYPPMTSEIWFSPMKLFEYMAAGKAIVATRTGQIEEVIQHGCNGLLVDAGAPDQMADTLVDLLNCPGQREMLGKNARRTAQEHHSWERFGANLENIYHAISLSD